NHQEVFKVSYCVVLYSRFHSDLRDVRSTPFHSLHRGIALLLVCTQWLQYQFRQRSRCCLPCRTLLSYSRAKCLNVFTTLLSVNLSPSIFSLFSDSAYYIYKSCFRSRSIPKRSINIVHAAWSGGDPTCCLELSVCTRQKNKLFYFLFFAYTLCLTNREL